eukprot:1320476-Pyramimonas_sp.AAC.2
MDCFAGAAQRANVRAAQQGNHLRGLCGSSRNSFSRVAHLGQFGEYVSPAIFTLLREPHVHILPYCAAFPTVCEACKASLGLSRDPR